MILFLTYQISRNPSLTIYCWPGYGNNHCWWECKMVQTLWRKAWQNSSKMHMHLLFDSNSTSRNSPFLPPPALLSEKKSGQIIKLLMPTLRLYILTPFLTAKDKNYPSWINNVHQDRNYTAIKCVHWNITQP